MVPPSEALAIYNGPRAAIKFVIAACSQFDDGGDVYLTDKVDNFRIENNSLVEVTNASMFALEADKSFAVGVVHHDNIGRLVVNHFTNELEP